MTLTNMLSDLKELEKIRIEAEYAGKEELAKRIEILFQREATTHHMDEVAELVSEYKRNR